MKKVIAVILIFLMALSLAGCALTREKTVFDFIRESPVARLELPEGSSCYVDKEIASLYFFADLRLMPAPVEPADREGDWLYRIVFNPAEKVLGAREIPVSFYKTYVQIGTEFYLPEEGVDFDSVLAWAASRFAYFMPEDAAKWDLIPMVMVDGVLYLDTGMKSTADGRCGTMDGEITSAVDGSEKPTENNQSNFGSGFGYQFGPREGTIEIFMRGDWWIFATEEVREQTQFPSK